jgi:hypothetical protein
MVAPERESGISWLILLLPRWPTMIVCFNLRGGRSVREQCRSGSHFSKKQGRQIGSWFGIRTLPCLLLLATNLQNGVRAGILYAHAPSWALSRILALRLHLDNSARENGPLRVIPGSHAFGVLSDEDVFRLARRQEAIECVVPRGGVLAMRPLLIHSSSKARANGQRRVLHIEYAESLLLDENIRLAVA